LEGDNFSGVSAELLDELRDALDRMKGDAQTRAEVSELTNTLRDSLDKIVQHGKADSTRSSRRASISPIMVAENQTLGRCIEAV